MGDSVLATHPAFSCWHRFAWVATIAPRFLGSSVHPGRSAVRLGRLANAGAQHHLHEFLLLLHHQLLLFIYFLHHSIAVVGDRRYMLLGIH